MRRFAVLLGCMSALSFGALRPADAQQSAKGITIATSLPAHVARARVAKALNEGGFAVADSTVSVIRTEPKTVQRVLHVQLFTKFLAVDDRSTRVVVTGQYTVDMMHEDPIAIEESSSGTAGEMWGELNAVGDRIRRALAPGRS